MIRQWGSLFRAGAIWFAKPIFTSYTPMMILAKWKGREGDRIVAKIFFLIMSKRRRSRTLFDCLSFDVKQVKLLWRETGRRERWDFLPPLAVPLFCRSLWGKAERKGGKVVDPAYLKLAGQANYTFHLCIQESKKGVSNNMGVILMTVSWKLFCFPLCNH
jgi:hypothetical protein